MLLLVFAETNLSTHETQTGRDPDVDSFYLFLDWFPNLRRQLESQPDGSSTWTRTGQHTAVAALQDPVIYSFNANNNNKNYIL